MTGRVVEQPGSFRAVPLGPAADHLRAGRRELRGTHARAGPPARPAVHGRGVRQPVRPSSLRGHVPTSRWANSGSAAARSRPAGAWPRPPTPTASRSWAPSPSRPPTASDGRSIPASIKALGDQAFCEGINRFVFHRYALQPWADVRPGHDHGAVGRPLRAHGNLVELDNSPGMSTLLDASSCCVRGSLPLMSVTFSPRPHPSGFSGHTVAGHGWDECSADVVMNRMKVNDGRLVLPDGMSYRLLVLPESATMTPALVGKIKQLVEAGATVVGPRPTRSPSLSGYPKCDDQLKSAGGWALGRLRRHVDQVAARGPGRVSGASRRRASSPTSGVRPDFQSQANLRSIHRHWKTATSTSFPTRSRAS